MKAIHLLAVYLLGPALAVVVWGELTKNASAVALEGLFWDKALHFIAYFGLSGMAGLAVKDWRRALVAAVSLILFGGVMEILQSYTGRDPSIFDALANSLGVLAGTLTGLTVIWLLAPKALAAGR